MERRPLGATGLDVPVVGMGTWRAFDVRGRDAEARCRAALDAAYDAGATLFDTSPMYGAAECVLAESMAARRDQALVADKLWTTDDREAERQAANALRWYRGRVDVYEVHLQIPYNARDRLAERELPPAASDHGIGVIVMRPLGEGSLLRHPPPAEALAPLAPYGVRTSAQALLKFILSDPRVSCAIPATSSPERMRENAEAGEGPWFDREAREYVVRVMNGY